VARSLAPTTGPIVAASDYVRAVADLARPYVPAGRAYTALGTDGFGRSDTRAALRAFFEVDRDAIVNAALVALGRKGGKPPGDAAVAPPWTR
jgi:pyruvate dehydrogenase E1 component